MIRNKTQILVVAMLANCFTFSLASASTTCPASLNREAYQPLDVDQERENVLLVAKAAAILESKEGQPTNQIWAKIVLGETLSPKELDLIKRKAIHDGSLKVGNAKSKEQFNKSIEDINRNDLDPQARRIVANTLGIFSDKENDFLTIALGKHESDATLDEVFSASSQVRLSFEHYENRRNDRKVVLEKLERDKRSERTELVLGDSHQAKFVQIYNNILRQIHKSKLFLGFGEPTMGVHVQVLKLTPREKWSEQAKMALKLGFPYHKESIERILSGNWTYVYFNGDVKEYAGTPVLDGHFYHEFLLRPISERAERAPGPDWFAAKANLGYTTALSRPTDAVMNASVELGFYPYTDTTSLKNSFSPSGIGGGFPLPLEIIDWENSVFSFSMSRAIPTNSLVAKSHSVSFYATNLGKEIVLIGGSSGRLRSASNGSGIATYGMNQWDSIPEKFRKVPETIEEMDEYLSWLASVNFKDSGRLTGASGRSRLLPGSN